MADNIDQMLQEDAVPPSSPGDNQATVPPKRELTPEEVEFNKLSGSTQDRVRELVRRARTAEELAQKFQSAPPAYIPQQPNPEVADAVRKLDQVGLATKDYVSQEVVKNLTGLRNEFELTRLEGKYTGEDGRPAFAREEYLDFVERHPQYRSYLPEDVYEKMYREELRDWQSKGTQTPRQAQTLKPTRTQVGEEPMTPEMIELRLKEPDGAAWYEKNFDKVNAVISKMKA